MSQGGIEKAAIDLLNMSRMHEDIDNLQMQSQLSFESGSSAGRSLQGYWFPVASFTKLNNQILDQTHLEGKWLYCVDSVVVKCDLFQVLQPLEGLKIYFRRTIWILEIFLFQV